jgi:hypothetical protein
VAHVTLEVELPQLRGAHGKAGGRAQLETARRALKAHAFLTSSSAGKPVSRGPQSAELLERHQILVDASI